ncbi:MAG: cob(I)yrinic acid a,c-diamide adenosyltransferase [Bacteroidia bacterium]|nr:cob(I)yrinic acid a,c-diamide adenosyltransferase [Bacteroidia bacterium]
MGSKVYTKTGDKGQTSLIGGTRVSKSDIRIEAYGTVDELNSFIGLLRDTIGQHNQSPTLIKIQNELFVLGALLAEDKEKNKMKLPGLPEDAIAFLEKQIDAMDAELPPMRFFVLPGGHMAVSVAHVCRTVCRRTERKVIELSLSTPVEEHIIRYLNRLSDYLFVLSRKLAHDFKVEEIPWKPDK